MTGSESPRGPGPTRTAARRRGRVAVHGWMIVGVLLLPACSADASIEGPTTAQLTLVEDLRYPESIEHPLTSVRALAAAESGEVFVLDRRDVALRYGADGRLIDVIGRAGEGPGEFKTTRWIGAQGENFWVSDVGLRRLTLFDRSGEVLKDWSTRDRTGAGDRSLVPMHLLESGSILASSRGGNVQEILSLSFDGSEPEIWTHVDRTGRGAIIRTSSGGVWDSPILGQLAPFDLVRAWRSGLVVIRRPEPVNPTEGHYVVSWISGSSTALSVEVLYEPAGITEAHLQGTLEAFEATGMPRMMVQLGFRNLEAVRAAAKEVMVIGSYLPPVYNSTIDNDDYSVIVASDGTVWLRRWPTPDTPEAIWDVIGPGGPVATVRAPADADLLAVRDDSVWGTVRDSLDVPKIFRYTLVPSEAAQRGGTIGSAR